MARSYQVAVGGAARVAIAGPTQGGGGSVYITNPTGGAATVYIDGEAGVTSITSTAGYPLVVGGTLGPITLAGGETLYAQNVSNTTTINVAVFRSGKVS